MPSLARLRLAAAAAVCALLLAPPAEAYYDDVHYSLTYYLARAVGYTPEQAHRIANADHSIDYDPDTEPVQQAAQPGFQGFGGTPDTSGGAPGGGGWGSGGGSGGSPGNTGPNDPGGWNCTAVLGGC